MTRKPLNTPNTPDLAADTVRPWWLLPPGRIHPAWWLIAFAAIVGADHFGGIEFFPLLYTIPVVLAAWYSGRGTALALAIAVPLVRLATLLEFPSPAGALWADGATTIARGIVVFFIALWFARLSEVERALDRHIRVLEGLLSICSFCKSIRNEGGKWEPLEVFISQRSDADFTHGLCPNCVREHYSSGWERTSHR